MIQIRPLIIILFFLTACSSQNEGSDQATNADIVTTLKYYDLSILAEQADVQFGAISPLFDDLSDVSVTKAKYAETIRSFLGTEPTTRAQLDATVIKEEHFADHIRRTVQYQVEPGDRVPAYLLIPVGYPLPRPAVLALHQTVSQGKDEPAGISGSPDMAYGLELVRRGYVVLIPDSITAGERVASGETPYVTTGFDLSHPDWSAMGKMLWDHQRGIDYLQTVEEVDQNKIGVIGHSLGGYNALFLAAFDERIKVVAASSAYTRIQTDPGKEGWSRLGGFVHFPKLRPYVEPSSTLQMPWDFQNVMALIAPRPLYQSFGLNDQIFTNIATVAQIERVVLPFYFQASGDLVTKIFLGEHSFPSEVRQMSYAFLGRHLNK